MFLVNYPKPNNDHQRKDRHSISMRVRKHNRNVRLKNNLKKPI
jgi:hypothetical protein